ncbi:MAG: PilZ domain-containing protein [Hyphomicrobium sp.]|nr:PilZ domain-containing protein [Hyphomicrobium sp.]
MKHLKNLASAISQDGDNDAANEHRRHKRVAIPLLGRFMRESKHEYPCKLNDISAGGMAVSSPVAVRVGERIIAYFDHIGGLEGTVVRNFDGGFAMTLNITAHKREKLAAQLTWLLNKDITEGIEQRRHERFVFSEKASTLELLPGVITECELLDVSISGASVATQSRPPIGSEVILGKLRSLVMRHHDKGIGVQFIDIQEPEALRKHFF